MVSETSFDVPPWVVNESHDDEEETAFEVSGIDPCLVISTDHDHDHDHDHVISTDHDHDLVILNDRDHDHENDRDHHHDHDHRSHGFSSHRATSCALVQTLLEECLSRLGSLRGSHIKGIHLA